MKHLFHFFWGGIAIFIITSIIVLVLANKVDDSYVNPETCFLYTSDGDVRYMVFMGSTYYYKQGQLDEQVVLTMNPKYRNVMADPCSYCTEISIRGSYCNWATTGVYGKMKP